MAINKCKTEESIKELIDYIGHDFIKVPYLYTNLYQYGIGNEDVEVWIDVVNDEINGVYLRYFTCLHFYTKDDNYPQDKFLDFLSKLEPKVIMTEEKFGKKICNILSSFDTLNKKNNKKISSEIIFNKIKHSYRKEIEYTYLHPCIDINKENEIYNLKVVSAQRTDLKEISELLLVDSMYKAVYNENDLHTQLLERYDEGYGVFFIIRDQKMHNNIIACIGVNGENNIFLFHGSLITHPEYRKKGIAKILLYNLLIYVRNRSKCDMAFILNHNITSQKLHEELGFQRVGSIFKFVRMWNA